MGEVYRADDLLLDQPVALKLVLPKLAAQTGAFEPLRGEVRLARRISHPNVARTFDIVRDGDRHFITMEFIDGEDLGSLLRRIGRLPTDKAVELARQLCAGLAAIHAKGVLHRDLKPSNVMIDGRGQLILTDFGVAGPIDRPADEPAYAGTPLYQAPEQLAGEEASVRSDLYALGLILYEMFTGRAAFEAGDFNALRRKRARGDFEPPSTVVAALDPAIDRAVSRCLEPDPARRFAGALSVAAALPGGDPLAAALASGETPSPEAVAAAGGEGSLRLPVATAWFAAFAVGVVLLVYGMPDSLLFHAYPPPLSPAVLADRARGALSALVPAIERKDEAWGLSYDWSHEGVPPTWPPYAFWYRSSPVPLRPLDASRRVSGRDPPAYGPGEAVVVLDAEGRLRRLTFRPSAERLPAAPPEPDWRPFFERSGLDLARSTPSDPEAPAGVTCDRFLEWLAPAPAGVPWDRVRVTAASLGGIPVRFAAESVAQVEKTESTTTEAAVWLGPIREAVFGLLAPAAFVGLAFFLAWRNVHRGRADRRGAILTGGVLLASAAASWVTSAHRPFADGFAGMWGMAGMAGTWGLLGAVFYLALEPFVRRRWPHALVGWTRLLAGDWRDPLVGTSVLVGSAAGMGTALLYVYGLRLWTTPWFGDDVVLDRLAGFSRCWSGLFAILNDTVLQATGYLLLFALLRFLLRRDGLAAGIFVALVTVFYESYSLNWFELGQTALAIVLLLTVLRSFGLLAVIAAMLAMRIATSYPIAFSPAESYAPAAWFGWAATVLPAVWGFRRSVGRLRSPSRRPPA